MNPDRTASDRAFVGFLESLLKRDDRATLAALRRALGQHPAAAIKAYPHVMPRVAPDLQPRERDREEQIYLLTAALFAFHQISWPRDDSQRGYTNLGASMARLASATDSAGVERRVSGLLACAFDDLPEHLRHAASLLKTKQIPIDWARLIADLRWWNTEDRRVQREWARAFWASTLETAQESEPAETGEETNVR
jgi:CRISPR system Cascade subunit CasB